MAKKRVRFHEHGLHDDIRYSGPLSFQSFQVLGWLCIVLTVVLTLMKIGMRLNPNETQKLATVRTVIEYFADLSLPFLLIANFARILNNSEGYRKQLLRNAGAMAAIAVVFLIFFSRYFNIFVDLLLCTLVMYCLNARPKKVFTGKKVLFLRFFAVLPIAYEAGSILLKALSAAGKVRIPVWAFPLLTVKPPMTFAVFVLLAIFIKTREIRYCRHGKTHEEYQAFLKTNRNAWNFSVYSAVILLIAGIIDLFILSFLLYGQAGSEEGVNAILASETAFKNSIGIAVGFGNSIILIFFSPIILLFNYTKIPKNKTVSMLVPVIGIGLIILIVIQGIYQLISIAPIPKMDGQALKEMLNSAFSAMSEV